MMGDYIVTYRLVTCLLDDTISGEFIPHFEGRWLVFRPPNSNHVIKAYPADSVVKVEEVE